MRRPLVHVLAAVCALVFGATPALASAPAVPSGAGGIIPSPLPPGQQPRGLRPDPAICPSGAERCVDNIVARMQRAYAAAGCSHNAAFSLLYLDTTLQIRDAVRGDEFTDRPFWNRITDTFGTYYLDSYQHWLKGEDTRVPEAWRIAFDDAASGTTSTLGDLFLGINAHVNRDLAYVYYQTGADNHADHLHVNEVLGRAVNVAYPDIAAHLDGTVWNQLEAAGVFPMGPTPIDLNIAQWREDAWHNAEALKNARNAAERADIAAKIDENAREHADQIEKAFPATPADDADRDAYCAGAPLTAR